MCLPLSRVKKDSPCFADVIAFLWKSRVTRNRGLSLFSLENCNRLWCATAFWTIPTAQFWADVNQAVTAGLPRKNLKRSPTTCRSRSAKWLDNGTKVYMVWLWLSCDVRNQRWTYSSKSPTDFNMFQMGFSTTNQLWSWQSLNGTFSKASSAGQCLSSRGNKWSMEDLQ